MNVYVGNLPFSVTDSELRAAFEAYGEVTSAQVIQDRDTQRSRGFGFVEMPSTEEANAAIQGLDGTDLGGRAIRVNEARPRGERRGGGGDRRGGGQRRGGFGGGGRRMDW